MPSGPVSQSHSCRRRRNVSLDHVPLLLLDLFQGHLILNSCLRFAQGWHERNCSLLGARCHWLFTPAEVIRQSVSFLHLSSSRLCPSTSLSVLALLLSACNGVLLLQPAFIHLLLDRGPTAAVKVVVAAILVFRLHMFLEAKLLRRRSSVNFLQGLQSLVRRDTLRVLHSVLHVEACLVCLAGSSDLLRCARRVDGSFRTELRNCSRLFAHGCLVVRVSIQLTPKEHHLVVKLGLRPVRCAGLDVEARVVDDR